MGLGVLRVRSSGLKARGSHLRFGVQASGFGFRLGF